MHDYLCVIPAGVDPADVLPYPLDDDGAVTTPKTFSADGNFYIVGQMVFARAVYDDDGNETSPQIVSPNTWFNVRTRSRDDTIWTWAHNGAPLAMVEAEARAFSSSGKFIRRERLSAIMQPTDPLGSFEPVPASEHYYPQMMGRTVADLADWKLS